MSISAGCGGDDEPAADAPRTVTVASPAPATTPDAGGGTSGAPGSVSRSRAIAVARKRVGGGRVDGVERDDDDGRAVWKVKLARAGGIERKVSIRVSDGRVLKVESDRDDRDGAGDRDGED